MSFFCQIYALYGSTEEEVEFVEYHPQIIDFAFVRLFYFLIFLKFKVNNDFVVKIFIPKFERLISLEEQGRVELEQSLYEIRVSVVI